MSFRVHFSTAAAAERAIDEAVPGTALLYFTGELGHVRHLAAVAPVVDAFLAAGSPRDQLVYRSADPRQCPSRLRGLGLGALYQVRAAGGGWHYWFRRNAVPAPVRLAAGAYPRRRAPGPLAPGTSVIISAPAVEAVS